MNKQIFIYILAGLLSVCFARAQSIGFTSEKLRFEWNVKMDEAKITELSSGANIWKGSILPAWWLLRNGKKEFTKASLVTMSSQGEDSWIVSLRMDQAATGSLKISRTKQGLQFDKLSVRWNGKVPAIISMYYGVRALNPLTESVTPAWDKPFMPDWEAAGYCIPGAKEGPAQSFFRSWDFGLANIALGSFGPSTGSPYGAAFPRPLYFAGMGTNNGFVALGAGSIPDAAMSLHIIGSRGCFEYLYREDLWGRPAASTRSWDIPLRICIDENAWQAFHKYFSTFSVSAKKNPAVMKAGWNSWGTWSRLDYRIAPIISMAEKAGAGLFVFDGSWEEQTGNARPDLKKFPSFYQDLNAAKAAGMDIGVWQSVGWVKDYKKEGLHEQDLLLNRFGKPCKANWNFDPAGESYYCLDPGSSGARDYLISRTLRLMKTIKPTLIKLDFGYGLPSPDMSAPRNHAFRGERYAYELFRLIDSVAKSIDSTVAIMYYGISPLWTELEDVVSLDDQGDLWYAAKEGHDEWSIWAALLSSRKTQISASSGYDWSRDEEAVLNSCILGVPSAVLPVSGIENKSISSAHLNRRLAINSWYRKTILWSPLWLNSHTGDMNGPPTLNCWGRMEEKDSASILTALVLRTDNKEKITDLRLSKMIWTSSWALISQDDRNIFSSQKLALIPFGSGSISIALDKKPLSVIRKNIEKSEPYHDWQWNQGMFTITINQELFENTAGFIIEP